MILKRIVEFAEKHASDMPSGYQPRLVTKAIRLDLDGKLIQVQALTGQKQGNREGLTRPEPQESPRRSVNVAARLFADNAEYVLGLVGEGRDAAKVVARHQAWCALVDRAAAETGNPRIVAVQKWIESGGPERLRDDQVMADDEITFVVDGQFVTDLPEVRAWWANRGDHHSIGQCLITGLQGPVTDRMPAPIKGIPNGQMSGTALVSVNNKAGESYGNEAALNSPISPAAAERLCNGLNVLLNEGRPVKDDKGKERTKYKYALRVGPAVYLAWGKEEVDDFWDIFDSPTPEQVHNLLGQPVTGGHVGSPSEADFYVMALSANAARIIVRDYHETTLANVKRNIAKWFKRLELTGPGEPLKPIGLYRLAASLYRDANKEMPAHVPTDLMSAALHGRPLSDYLLGLAVKRNLAMQGPFALTKAKTKTLSTSRLALIKAALTPDPEDTSLNELNLNQSNPAYHCGRMLAVLESIQRLAVPGLNATLVDRNYGAACASPASIFGNLLKDATSAHLPKLRKNRPGAYVALDRRLQEVAVAIGPDFPRTLTLKDQGLFSLGYYHQRAWDMAEAKKNRELKELAELDSAQEEDTTE